MENRIITLFYRKSGFGVSIERLFADISAELAISNQLNQVFLPYRGGSNLCHNVLNGIYAAQRKSTVNHITGDVHYIASFLPRNSTILTVHDLGLLNEPSFLRRILKRWIWFSLPLKHARFVTAISNYTKSEIIKRFKIPNEKIHVIHNCVSGDFHFVHRDFNKENPTVLCIGTKSNKNLTRIARALSGLNCHIKVIGSSTAELNKLTTSGDYEIHSLGRISDEQILLEYINCDIVMFPSTYEGFGLPILEGQAVGRPVITSNIGPMPEVAGKGALLVDPYSIESIRNAFVSIVRNDSLRSSLISSGLENVKLYTAKETARKYESLYSEIVK